MCGIYYHNLNFSFIKFLNSEEGGIYFILHLTRSSCGHTPKNLIKIQNDILMRIDAFIERISAEPR